MLFKIHEDTKMPEQLYIFQTRYASTGVVVQGTAGLPLQDMIALRTFYPDKVSLIVRAPDNTPLLEIRTPVVPAKK